MKLVLKKLYIVPFTKYAKSSKREILFSGFRLARFEKVRALSCQLHGDLYANVYEFRIKPPNPNKPWKDSWISIQIDCNEDTPSATILKELFEKIKVYDPEIHGKTEEEFNKIFNPITN